jgi:hypothetical protein
LRDISLPNIKPPYGFIATGLREGNVVPFFGAAASAIYRPKAERWEPGKPFMPFGGELAASLASAANYPTVDQVYEQAVSDVLQTVQQIAADIPAEKAKEALTPVLRKHVGAPPNLAIIASWAELQGNRRYIDHALRKSFAVDCSPGLLHIKLASIEGTQLYVTTNYDDLLEKALACRQPHVIIDRGNKAGLWVSVAGGPLQKAARTGSDLYDLLNDPATQQPSHPIVFKMHGSVDKNDPRNDWYLITEEDYVDFLAGDNYVPPYVSALMEGKDILFLGYSLEDWNVRVILRKLVKRAVPEPVSFWAIVRGRSDIEQQIWQARDVNIYPMDLGDFAEELAKQL